MNAPRLPWSLVHWGCYTCVAHINLHLLVCQACCRACLPLAIYLQCSALPCVALGQAT